MVSVATDTAVLFLVFRIKKYENFLQLICHFELSFVLESSILREWSNIGA